MERTLLILRRLVFLVLTVFYFSIALSQTNNKTVFLTRVANKQNPAPSLNPASVTNITICNNQLPFDWNGNTYLAAGTFTVLLTGSDGSDSTAILNLSVTDVATSITNINICNNHLPYSWNGNSYSASGTYSVTLTTTTGCDSVPILSLTVNNVVTSITNTTVCSNRLPYSWNGNTYSSAGSYSVTLTSVAGCDSVASLNLSINPFKTSTTNVTVCASELPYNWNGNSYPTPGIYIDTLAANNGCDSIATLDLSVNTASVSSTAVTICNNDLPYSWNGNIYPTGGTYSVTLPGTSGCDSVATLVLTVRAVHTSLTNITTCTSQLPYTWNGNSYSAPGLYQVTLTGAAGCDSVPRLQLNVVPFLTSSTTSTICNTDLPFQWNGNSYSGPGTYSVTLTSVLGCDSIATLVLDVATIISTISNVIICSTQLPFTWNGNTYYGPGTYTVTFTGGTSCDSSATLNLIVQPVIPSTTNIAVCSNLLPYNWNGYTYPETGSYSVTLTGSSGCDSVANLNLTVAPAGTSTTNIFVCSSNLPYSWNQNLFTETGVYPVTLAGTNGCDSVATLNLVVVPPLSSTTDITVCTNQLPYTWNGNAYSTPGTYTAILTGTGGCDSVATLELTINPFLTSTINVSICINQAPYTWNGNNYFTTGSYPVTLTAASGCDSIVTLNLVVNTLVTDSINLTICNNQLPYSWNGNLYATAGSYSFASISSAGCDSLTVLNLFISGAVASVTDLTICTNQLPYSWNGNSYPLAGNFPVTLTTASGCDSLAILNLTVTEILTSTTNVTVCSSGLPYSWNGNVYSEPGTYSITMSNANGCDSVPILSLTLQPVITDTINTTICSNQLPFLWNGNNYYSSGSYSLALTGTGGCDSVITMNLFVLTVDTTVTDISMCSNQLPYNWNGNSYFLAGNYPVTLANSTGCDSIAILNLAVDTAGTSVTEVHICSTQSTYIWNGNSYTESGTYSIILTSSSGCDSVATLNLTKILPDTSVTGINICNSQLPYSWNGNEYASAGNYNVTFTGSTGCDSVAVLDLSVNATPVSWTAVTICDNQLPFNWNGNEYASAGTYSITLTGSNGCDSVATLNLITAGNLSSDTNITICNNQLPYNWNGNNYAAAGAYTVTLVSTGGCDSVLTLHLSISSLLTGSTEVTVCNSQLPYLWNGNFYSVTGSYSVSLTSAFGCDSLSTLNLTVTSETSGTTTAGICDNQLPYLWNGNSYSAGGTYQLTLTSAGGCDSIDILNLTIYPVLTSTTAVNVCNTQLPYSWNGNTYAATGVYPVTLTGSTGCDSIASLELTVTAVLTSISDITICLAQLPYEWNGNSYPAAGTYSLTLTSGSGCDSIATLDLSVNNILSSNTITNICSTQLPYSWNGNIYSSAGNYQVTLTAAGGCDSVATLLLNVGNVVTSTTAITICNNQLPYSWNGNNYPAAGAYDITLTGNNGCDSVATLVLTVHSATASLTTKTICSNELPYSWNGQSLVAAGIHSVTLANSSGCDSIANLKLIVNPVKTTSVNEATCTNELPYLWNGHGYATPGQHSITLVTSLGCDSIVTLNLVIHPVTTSSTSKNVCDNHLPYQWNGQSFNTSGIYTVTLTNSAGCDSVATLNLKVNPVKYSTTNTSICSAELPYTWNGQSYTSSGLHTVMLTSSAGCDSLATLNLTINPTPARPGVISPVIYCQYDITRALTATVTTPGSQLIWYTSATGGTGSVALPVPSSGLPGNINYYVSQLNGPCEGERSLITVTVNSKPGLGPDKALQICYERSANLEDLYNTAAYITNWTSAQVPVINPAAADIAGIYQLIVKNDAGCADTALVNLGIQPQVIAQAGVDANAEYNEPYQLNGSGGVEYQWSPGSMLNNPFIANPVAVLNNDATFILMVKDEIGCMAFDTVKLRVFKGPTFYVPTAFTPNGDGLNDIFRPTPIGIASLEYFRVFNRYGEIIFETHDMSKGWDGNYRGIKQNSANYVWSVKGTDRTGAVKAMKGNVVLIR